MSCNRSCNDSGSQRCPREARNTVRRLVGLKLSVHSTKVCYVTGRLQGETISGAELTGGSLAELPDDRSACLGVQGVEGR